MVVYLYLAILVLSQQFADPAKVLQEYDKELLSLQSACNSTANAFCGTAFLTPPPAEVGNVTRPGNSTAFMNQNNERSVSLLSALSVSPNIPVFAILSLICYAGWLRVAESHVFPFGDEDDHFETLPLMDRNFKTSLWFVDHMIQPEQLPPLLQMASVSDLAPSRGNGEAVVTQDSLNFLSPNIVNQRAMGWKRKIKRPTQLKNSGSTELPVIAITAPDDEPSIPELPCPSELRRRVSRHFFAGSMTRVYGDESSTTNPSLDPTTTNNNLRPSLPIFSTNDSLAQPVYWTGSMGMSFLGDTNPRASNSRRMFSSATTASSDPDGESTPNVVRL
ncbi:unnamed protein product [Echinostoma caproni]|uniref:Bestrophin homolog n=1 Tax=Echinostoma caproni TaxID=27848 RepID=A0A3P8H2M9_9TREM|nr:unnamed protein product [Echinostoma caproni]